MIDVVMPVLSENAAEGTVMRWYVGEGDYVYRDQRLVEVAGYKVETDVQSPASGVVASVVAATGAVVPRQGVLCRIDETALAEGRDAAPPRPPELAPPAPVPMSTRPAHTHGVATPAQVAGMSGREVLQAIVDGRLPQAPISKTLGFWIVEVGDGAVVFEGEPSAELFNPMGTVHGGWALAILDSVTGAAGHSTLPPGAAYTTLETKGHFSRPITAATGRIRAEGRVVSAGRTIISAEGAIRSADGRILAHGTSTLLVLGGSPSKP